MMRTSAPRPKPVKRKTKKNVKRRPLKVPRHALERLPDDYIVGRDPTGRPRDLGTPGLPVASNVQKTFVAVNNLIHLNASSSTAGSQYASSSIAASEYEDTATDYGEGEDAFEESENEGASEEAENEEAEDVYVDAEAGPTNDLVPPEAANPTTPTAPPRPEPDEPGQTELDLLAEEVEYLQRDVNISNQRIIDLELELQQQQNASTERFEQLQAALVAENESLIRTQKELAQARERRPTTSTAVGASPATHQHNHAPAAAIKEEFVELPDHHNHRNHAPAAEPAGRGSGRALPVPVGEQQRNAAFQGGESRSGRERKRNPKYAHAPEDVQYNTP